jgi:protein-tyrosine kinase
MLFQQETTKLVHRLFLTHAPTAPKSVVLCGIDRGSGSSFICWRAAEILASQAEGSVCVVDANLRSPSLHEYFQVDKQRGLTDAVLQPGPVREFTQQLPAGNLWVFACGSRFPDTNAFFALEGLRARMIELRTAFDYILVDVAPPDLFVDAITVGRLVDGAILVLEANTTRREKARQAKEVLESANVRILGAVLNRRVFPIPERLYARL